MIPSKPFAAAICLVLLQGFCAPFASAKNSVALYLKVCTNKCPNVEDDLYGSRSSFAWESQVRSFYSSAGYLLAMGTLETSPIAMDVSLLNTECLECGASRNLEGDIGANVKLEYNFKDGSTLPSANEIEDALRQVEPEINKSFGALGLGDIDRIATATGTCKRTDPKQNYVGRAYCQYYYDFVGRRDNLEATTLIEEGPITKGDINTLSITGGSGIFRRAVGTVILESGNIRSGNPPIFIPNDRLDLPSSYLGSDGSEKGIVNFQLDYVFDDNGSKPPNYDNISKVLRQLSDEIDGLLDEITFLGTGNHGSKKSKSNNKKGKKSKKGKGLGATNINDFGEEGLMCICDKGCCNSDSECYDQKLKKRNC